MTYRGHIRNGTVVLDEGVKLPEGVAVEITLSIVSESATSESGQKKSHPVGLMRFAGTASGLPPDASQNVDHYLYGHPRQ